MANESEEEDEPCPCSEEYISSYWLTRTGTVPGNILEFDYSYGYNCKRLFNLCLIDPDVLVFSSGNLLHFYRISTKGMTFRRSASGGGIGCILKNPNPQYNYLTVAENGENPNVFIYKFPSMEIISILENGAQYSYTTCAYRQDGELLATQSGEPDYMLTIWRWETSQILLRTKSFQNDILNVIFSPHNPILLTTCGLTHIKFWKMAKTFTGLKLQGDLGRFGKTEISDIYSIYPMYDETVISGCDWGNLLVWEAGLIKIEVCRKTRKPCHTGPVTLITMDEYDIMTAGLDGYVRIWFWETVEIADPPDDDRFVEIEPIFEFYIGDKDKYCEIRSLIKIYPEDKENFHYYAQDGKGGIWFCDLNKDQTPEAPKKIFTCHGGKVVAADSSPITNHIATLGEEGHLHFYDYKKKKLVYNKSYTCPGSDILWLPTTIDSTGLVLLIGFNDGVLRQICVEFKSGSHSHIVAVHLINIIKSHTQSITNLSINQQQTVLVSTARDKTIFLYQIKKPNNNEYVKLIPIGYVQVASIPNAITWKNDEDILALACSNGEIIELTNIPVVPDNTEVTFHLANIDMKIFKFTSIKSLIRLQIKLDAKAKKLEAKKNAKLAELKRLQQLNPGMVIDEDLAVEDSDEETEEEPLYFPPSPNTIFWLKYTPKNTIWISVGGYDAGYIYEIEFGLEKPVRSTIIADADDVEIYSYLHIEDYLIWAIQGGMIRINAVQEDYLDLSDYWIMGMHDNNFANVPKIFTNRDGLHLFTIGHDGNIFSYNWNGPIIKKIQSTEKREFMKPSKIEDIIYSDHPSLEQQKVEAERNRRLKISNEHKAKILQIVATYNDEYEEILNLNKNIAPSQQYKQYPDLELDPRITNDLVEKLNEQLDLVRRKLEFDVEKAKLGREKVIEYFIEPLENLQFTVMGIQKNIKVNSFKVHKLSSDIDEIKKEIDARIQNLKHVSSNIELLDIQRSLDIIVPAPGEEKFFLGYRPENLISKFSNQMYRLLLRYRHRKSYEIKRFVDWEKIKYKKPDPNKNHPIDEQAIREAERSIGDYKLKINVDYVPPLTNNVLYKYQDLLNAREELFNLKNNFNLKLLKLRDNKKRLYQFIDDKQQYLNFIQKQMPKIHHKEIPKLIPIDINLEYPEQNLNELVKPGTGIEIEDLLLENENDTIKKKKLITTIFEYKFNEENLENEEFKYQNLEWQMLNIENIDQLPDYNELSLLLDNPFQFIEKDFTDFLSNIEINTRVSHENQTPWEIEKCYRWIIDKIVEQDIILNEIADKINDFEMELNQLNETKMEIKKDAKFLEIFLLTLTEELGILKDCEQLETELIEKTEKAYENRNIYLANILEASKLSEELRKSNEKMTEQIKTIQTTFLYNIKGTKFYDFLRRIFKKKYKPPKEKNDDSESESESESSSSDEEEEDDEKSLESVDIAPIRLDEDTCPQGCDIKLYELAFTFRSERHDLEKSIYTQNKLLEDEKKKVDDMTKKLRLIEQTFITERKNLMDFRFEKQKVLNKVETLILVNMDQIQYSKDDTDINEIQNTLLFNSNMINELHTRVGQLDVETLETKRVHRINIVHLQRMTTDCKHMRRQINILEETVKQAMRRKFGDIINLDELEESTLRRYVYDSQTSLSELRNEIAHEVALKKIRLAALEKELCREVQKHTEKLNILTVLHEEKNFLSDTLAYQKRLLERTSNQTHIDFRPDIKRLANIREVQNAQIEFLEREIRTLRIKSKPLEVQPIEQVLNTAGLPGTINEDNQKIDESAFINLQSISYQFGPDVYTSDRILKIVQKFALKHFRKIMSDENIKKYSKKISQYLGFVGKNFDYDQFDQITKCVIENFENLVPKKYLIHIKTDHIKDLFKEVMTVFNYEKTEVNIDEVLNGIVANAIEITNHVKLMNITQAILVEVYKEMIEVLTIEDICKSTTLDKLCELLLINTEFNPRCINTISLVKDVIQHAKENFIDEFTQTPVKNSVEQLIVKLMQKIKPEKPLEK